MMSAELITQIEYSSLQAAYDHFNVMLFDDQLPGALITLQRKNGTYGYFSCARFVARGSAESESADEIALNPDVFAEVDDTEIMQTLVHEMAHQWQFHFGKPSRRSYHNKQWAGKMEAIGLMPSSTGEPGGKKTGQHMADYPIKGGPFEEAWKSLSEDGFKVGWESRDTTRPATISISGTMLDPESPEELVSIQVPPAPPRPISKLKYSCPECSINVWGKPGLKLLCGHCYDDNKVVILREIKGSGS